MTDQILTEDVERTLQNLLFSSRPGKSYDLIVTIEIRPGARRATRVTLIKKRKSRKKEAPDGRQADLFAS